MGKDLVVLDACLKLGGLEQAYGREKNAYGERDLPRRQFLHGIMSCSWPSVIALALNKANSQNVVD